MESSGAQTPEQRRGQAIHVRIALTDARMIVDYEVVRQRPVEGRGATRGHDADAGASARNHRKYRNVETSKRRNVEIEGIEALNRCNGGLTRTPLAVLFKRGDLVEAALMAPGLILGTQPNVDHPTHQLFTDEVGR